MAIFDLFQKKERNSALNPSSPFSRLLSRHKKPNVDATGQQGILNRFKRSHHTTNPTLIQNEGRKAFDKLFRRKAHASAAPQDEKYNDVHQESTPYLPQIESLSDLSELVDEALFEQHLPQLDKAESPQPPHAKSHNISPTEKVLIESLNSSEIDFETSSPLTKSPQLSVERKTQLTTIVKLSPNEPGSPSKDSDGTKDILDYADEVAHGQEHQNGMEFSDEEAAAEEVLGEEVADEENASSEIEDSEGEDLLSNFRAGDGGAESAQTDAGRVDRTTRSRLPSCDALCICFRDTDFDMRYLRGAYVRRLQPGVQDHVL